MTPSERDRDAMGHVMPPCHCEPDYKDRGLMAPDCSRCQYGEDVVEAKTS